MKRYAVGLMFAPCVLLLYAAAVVVWLAERANVTNWQHPQGMRPCEPS